MIFAVLVFIVMYVRERRFVYFLSGARGVNHGEQGVESTEFEVGTLMQDFPQDF